MRSSYGDNERGFLDGSPLLLAPMAGFTSAPFRLVCFEFGADFAVTGMVSAEGLVRGSPRTKRFLERMVGEGPVGAQLFGSNPETVARAASVAAESSPAFIDLNFGCPVRKVIRKNGGVAIMRDLDLMGRICESVSREVDLPVTAKIRSGWSRTEENFIEAGRVLEGSGIAAVALHPRYRTQGFSGDAHWEHIAKLERALSIPVIANGDVRSVGDYEEIVRVTGCRIVMIGRGAYGCPWIFREIKDRLEGREPVEVGITEIIGIIERHVRMEVEWKGERVGILEMRKHYRWYLRGLPGMKGYRCRLSVARTLGEVVDSLNDLREEFDNKCRKPA